MEKRDNQRPKFALGDYVKLKNPIAIFTLGEVIGRGRGQGLFKEETYYKVDWNGRVTYCLEEDLVSAKEERLERRLSIVKNELDRVRRQLNLQIEANKTLIEKFEDQKKLTALYKKASKGDMLFLNEDLEEELKEEIKGLVEIIRGVFNGRND
jgi:hypothetical protein